MKLIFNYFIYLYVLVDHIHFRHHATARIVDPRSQLILHFIKSIVRVKYKLQLHASDFLNNANNILVKRPQIRHISVANHY